MATLSNRQIKKTSVSLCALLLVSCSTETTSADVGFVCNQDIYEIGGGKMSIRLSGGVKKTLISSLVAEVAYGTYAKSASYIESDARYTITLSENQAFPECIIVIDKLSGAASQNCFGRESEYPNDIRANSFEFQCKV